MEISQLLDEADESIEAFDNRLARAARDVVEKLEEQADNGIDLRLVSGSQARDRLELLQRAGAKVRELTELTRSAYYIIDGDQVLMNLSSGDATVVVQDTDISTIIRSDFEETFTEASEVPDND
jgi:hypothetical protein